MKMIQAIIKPFKLDDVKEALKAVGVTGMTVSEVKGFGRQKGHTEVYRGAEYEIEFIPKIQLDIAVSDDKVDSVIKAIQESANTNKIGDGKIFVTSVEQAVELELVKQEIQRYKYSLIRRKKWQKQQMMF